MAIKHTNSREKTKAAPQKKGAPKKSPKTAPEQTAAVPTAPAEGTTPAQEELKEVPQLVNSAPEPPEKTVEWLKWCGGRLDEPPPANRRIGPYKTSPEAIDWREYMMWALLNIRGKNGRLRKLILNRAQQDLERRSSSRNIVLKARQLGVTTYVAARFFISTISREGTLSVQVAHDQRSAEEIFRIVHRFLDNLPEQLRKGALVTSRANVRQIVFPMLEGVFGAKSGANKKAAVLSFVQTAVTATDSVANKSVVDPNKFNDGLSKVIDGVVQCLNASVWANKQ